MSGFTRFALGAAIILAANATFATAQPPQAPPAPVATVTFPNDVTMQGDLPYATVRGYRPLTLDLYLPKSQRPFPVVVFVHGGAWAGGTARSAEIIGDDFPKMFAGLAAKGYAVASINYRLSSEAKFPAQVQDLNAAIRYLRTNAARLGLDTNRMVTWGASAGAHIAMLSAFDCKSGKLETATAGAPSTCVTGIVDWFGPTTLMSAEPSGAALSYLGCKPADCEESWRQTTVASAITPDAPPILIVHGDADTTVPLAQSQALEQTYKAAGLKVQLKTVPGGNHLFRGAARGEIDAAIAATMDFIAQQIGPRP